MRATTTPTYTPVPIVMERAARNRARRDAMLASGKSPLFTALVVWKRRKCKRRRWKSETVWRDLERERERERDWPIFQKRRNYRSRPVSFCGAVRKIWMMGPLAERLGVTWEELIMRGGTKKKKWQLVRKCQGRKVMVISAAGTEW